MVEHYYVLLSDFTLNIQRLNIVQHLLLLVVPSESMVMVIVSSLLFVALIVFAIIIKLIQTVQVNLNLFI